MQSDATCRGWVEGFADGFTVHDELLFEGPESELRRIAPQLVEIMASAYQLKAMLHVDLKLGHNWEDMHPVAVASLAHA